MRLAVDANNVLAGDELGALLRRGLAVAGFNLLEAFIETRFSEIAGYLNDGIVQFPDLPDRMQTRAIVNTMAASRLRMRRIQAELPALKTFARDLGTALRTVDHGLALSPLMWLWDGSNLSAADYSFAIGSFHVDKVWQEAERIAQRVGLPKLDLRAALEDIARERHACAHDASHGVTALWLRTVPERVLALALALDVLISAAAVVLRSGNAAFLTDEKWMTANRVDLRFVRERVAGAAEYAEGGKRASKLGDTAAALFADAATRCGPATALVWQDSAGGVKSWAFPALS